MDTVCVNLQCWFRDPAALNETKCTNIYRAKITVLFPLLTKPEGSILCSKGSVILPHSDPHEPKPQHHFGSRGLTNYTLCHQKCCIGLQSHLRSRLPSRQPKIILCKTFPISLVLPFVKNGSF